MTQPPRRRRLRLIAVAAAVPAHAPRISRDAPFARVGGRVLCAECARGDWGSADSSSSHPPRNQGTRFPQGRRVASPGPGGAGDATRRPCRSEEHTSELQSQSNLVCRLLLEKKKHQTYSENPRLAV